MSDLISRQTAIGALCKRCDLVSDDEPCTEECNDIKILRLLPSAQPTQSNVLNALDTIYRQAAIDAICDYTDDLFNQITALEDLPSAQPELPSCGYCPFAKCIIGDRPCSMKGVERVE